MSQTVPTSVQGQIESLILKLRRRQLRDSTEIALQVTWVLRSVIASTRGNHADALLDAVRAVGRRLELAQPTEVVVGNIVRRILYLIREECHVIEQEQAASTGARRPGEGDSTYFIGDAPTTASTDYTKNLSDLKAIVRDSLKDLQDELETHESRIANEALEHIHSNEIIMTLGNSRTVLAFLLKAAKTRRFQVIVAETAPSFDGHKMAKTLAQNNIDTTVINDSAIFAVMSRVNKVILGTHAVTVNGGLVASAGVLTVANAAKNHSVPVVVCCGLYKVSPIYPYDTEELELCMSPEEVLGRSEGEFMEQTNVVNPSFEYVPPDLVALFITNVGSHSPTYMYRLISEFYSKHDQSLN
ncbi:translation initiation factor eIF-2B beta subunit [Gonapodya prolifera JEL478]|uniref:Translation initiation factor eIF2B subunit beta n=1 Tax=Gonapodya prolifera (strain JEL478) TaxID=1344416 RepID=A0A139AWC2_GONPJ|nr:translation initiation factor eIF-2B beta subunit [Gonapodya prolifera JEL478]|eukprot:KXS20883.1 translation initiation factor eIF-2B beta subunit [Gonapodya prolifera JEL478]